MASRFLTWLVRCYQTGLAGTFGGRCRFYPSCSEYAIEAIEEHGASRGLVMALRRFSRCAPWSRGGIDPVVPAGVHRGRG